MATIARSTRLVNPVLQKWVRQEIAPSSFSLFSPKEKEVSRRFLRREGRGRGGGGDKRSRRPTFSLNGLGLLDGKTLAQHIRVPATGPSSAGGLFFSNRDLRKKGSSPPYRPLVLMLRPVTKAGRAGGSRYTLKPGAASAYQRYIERKESIEENALSLPSPSSQHGFNLFCTEGLSSCGSIAEKPSERSRFWRINEERERAGGRTQYRIIAELPYDISAEDRFRIVRKFGEEFQKRGFPWHGVVHLPDKIRRPERKGDPRNWHMHFVYLDRPFLRQDGVESSLGTKDRQAQGRQWIRFLRARFAELQNDVLAEYQSRFTSEDLDYWAFSRRITPYSYEHHEMEGHFPQKHLGARLSSIEQKGIVTEKGLHNIAAQSFNNRLVGVEQHLDSKSSFENILVEQGEIVALLRQIGGRSQDAPNTHKALSLLERRAADIRDKANDLYEIFSIDLEDEKGNPLQTESLSRLKAERQDALARTLTHSGYSEEGRVLESAKSESLLHARLSRSSSRLMEEQSKSLSDFAWLVEEGLRRDMDGAQEFLDAERAKIDEALTKPTQDDWEASLQEKQKETQRRKTLNEKQRKKLVSKIHKEIAPFTPSASEEDAEEVLATLLRHVVPPRSVSLPTSDDLARLARDPGRARCLEAFGKELRDFGLEREAFRKENSQLQKALRDHHSEDPRRQNIHYLSEAERRKHQQEQKVFREQSAALGRFAERLDQRLYLPKEQRVRMLRTAAEKRAVSLSL